MPRCPHCSDGKRYRMHGSRRVWTWCPTCGGTGQKEPTVETFRETRLRREAVGGKEGDVETARAALADGPKREHGDPDKAEEELDPSRAPGSVATAGNAPPTTNKEA